MCRDSSIDVMLLQTSCSFIWQVMLCDSSAISSFSTISCLTIRAFEPKLNPTTLG